MIKYTARVTGIGPLTAEFVEAGMLVLFGASAPDELHDFAIIHDGQVLSAPVVVGDQVHIDGRAYQVLAIGEVANDNLGNLGHLVLKFNGQSRPELPGDVCLEAQPLPDIAVGTVFQITGSD
jgi:PTS system glucitol/sorbitol-specific IIA component